eukprot:768737-Hanusia_phi.AAC.2
MPLEVDLHFTPGHSLTLKRQDQDRNSSLHLDILEVRTHLVLTRKGVSSWDHQHDLNMLYLRGSVFGF